MSTSSPRLNFPSQGSTPTPDLPASGPNPPIPPSKKKPRSRADPSSQKRRCVSTACIACRKRKSKCDGAIPSCAACSSVYGTECVYDPNSDHRRKGVYREKIDSAKARDSTLQILIESILNAAEEDVPEIVRRIRTCDSLDNVAESMLQDGSLVPDAPESGQIEDACTISDQPVQGERDFARKMGELRIVNGVVRYIGGTSNLIYYGDSNDTSGELEALDPQSNHVDAVTSWTEVTKDRSLVTHLLNMYWNWHYPYFTTISKKAFWRDFSRGRPRNQPKAHAYCSSLLVNAMLALGCHFTDVPGAYAVPGDSQTKGDHFFAEARRLILENDEYEKPCLVTVQALALMSVREAGCGREAKGWFYSGISFRMAQDIGLNLDTEVVSGFKDQINDEAIDARRITFWGCFLFDKCWSNYLGRLPQLPKSSYNVSKFNVFPDEDGDDWTPYTDNGYNPSLKQPARTRAAALQLSKLCEISSDLLLFFYHPNHLGGSSGKSVELKKLSELHRRLEDWRRELPAEFEPKDGQLPNVILMHMFYHLQYIHLFRPFLKYNPSASPLPPHVSPRRICSSNAGFISKLMRLYKKLYNLRQICNIAVYMVHSACTIHLLNLPDKTARRDIIHGVKQLQEIAEDWLCARRTLSIISVLARKWKCDMPEEAATILRQTDEKYGHLGTADVPSPSRPTTTQFPASPATFPNSPAQASVQEYNNSPSNRVDRLDTEMSQPPQQTDFSPGFLSNLGSLNSTSMPPNTSAHNTDPELLLSTDNTWSMPPVGQHSVPQYYQTYAPVQQQQPQPQQPRATNGSSTRSNQMVRKVTYDTPYAIDGQDWFLKDGVNWQQNFESWGLGGSPINNTSNGSNGDMASGDVFLFKGIQSSDLDFDDVWGFEVPVSE